MRKKALFLLPAFLLLEINAGAVGQNLIPVGEPVGLLLEVDGAIVDSLSAFETSEGKVCPAEDAGFEAGDLIVRYAGETVHGCDELAALTQKNGENENEVTVLREGHRENLSVTPKKDKEGKIRLGIMVKETQSGLGTVTYYDPETGSFGALGHGIQTGPRMSIPIKTGAVYRINLKETDRGTPGKAGELQGDLTGESIGETLMNTPGGVFGTIQKGNFEGEALPIAAKEELHTGEAEILSSISGEAKRYSIRIISVGNEECARSLRLQVTDPDLIGLTGGIVRGMSGSPIIQDGKLAGAVTHVLLGDPTVGYGIAIEDMLKAAEGPAERAA